MDDDDWLAQQFEEHRPRLRALAYRMLGDLSEADDAVQETWQRLSRTGSGGIDNLGGWLTTVAGRVCLNLLRSRSTRREDPLDPHVPDPIITSENQGDPEHEAVLADSVGLALLVVLETLAPAERVAFVLHDMFGVSFDEIAAMTERSPAAARQLASRARRRVQGAPTVATSTDDDLARQREAREAFFAAARGGDLDALVAVLDPDVVLRYDAGATGPGQSTVVQGAENVARGAILYSRAAPFITRVLVNGAPGVVVAPDGVPTSIMSFTVVDDRIVAIHILADPDRLSRLDLPSLSG